MYWNIELHWAWSDVVRAGVTCTSAPFCTRCAAASCHAGSTFVTTPLVAIACHLVLTLVCLMKCFQLGYLVLWSQQ